MPDMRYLNSKDKFLDYTYDVFREFFDNDKEKFKNFFDSIKTDKNKNKFLKIGGFFKVLVKDGRFLFSESESEDIYIDYVDSTYKVIAIFSLLEYLYLDDKFLTFYDWLMQKSKKNEFPIDRDSLPQLYAEYNLVYGATRKAVNFFDSLDDESKKILTDSVEVLDNASQRLSVEALSKWLYQIRSDFVHQAILMPQLSNGTIYSSRIHNGKQLSAISLSLNDLSQLVKIGVLRYFGYENK